jgi:hypothetical protein
MIDAVEGACRMSAPVRARSAVTRSCDFYAAVAAAILAPRVLADRSKRLRSRRWLSR